MRKQTHVGKPVYSLLPTDVEGFDSLAELALDMRWSWNHDTDEVWQQLDPALWEFTQNPWVVLQTVSRDKLQRVSANPAFRKKVDALVQTRRQAAKTPAWFQQDHPRSPLTHVAYFSMEFMLSEALPIYSGGLGNVAGDQLKAASDLGVPVVGVGLLYQQSNDLANLPAHRGITSELYGGGPELRLNQELVLGIGGWRIRWCSRAASERMRPRSAPGFATRWNSLESNSKKNKKDV
jgi:glucan phosphorylase